MLENFSNKRSCLCWCLLSLECFLINFRSCFKFHNLNTKRFGYAVMTKVENWLPCEKRITLTDSHVIRYAWKLTRSTLKIAFGWVFDERNYQLEDPHTKWWDRCWSCLNYSPKFVSRKKSTEVAAANIHQLHGSLPMITTCSMVDQEMALFACSIYKALSETACDINTGWEHEKNSFDFWPKSNFKRLFVCSSPIVKSSERKFVEEMEECDLIPVICDILIGMIFPSRSFGLSAVDLWS